MLVRIALLLFAYGFSQGIIPIEKGQPSPIRGVVMSYTNLNTYETYADLAEVRLNRIVEKQNQITSLSNIILFKDQIIDLKDANIQTLESLFPLVERNEKVKKRERIFLFVKLTFYAIGVYLAVEGGVSVVERVKSGRNVAFTF